MFAAYSVVAYDPESGDILIKDKIITAKTPVSARDKAIRMLPEDADLDTIRVVVSGPLA